MQELRRANQLAASGRLLPARGWETLWMWLNCEACGAVLPSDTGRGPGAGCARCGSVRLVWHDEGTVVATAKLSGSEAVIASNLSAAKRDELEAAIDRIEHAVASRDVADAQAATKAALEAMHALEDGRRLRQEWSYASWSQTEIDAWHAHMPARNAAHHYSDPFIALRSGTEESTRLSWDVPTTTLTKLRYQDYVPAYVALLHGQPVVTTLRAALASLSRVLPSLA